MPNATAKTELYAQWLQGRLVVADEGQSTGARFWVHSGTGTNSAGHGKSPDSPFASLDYASTQCTASKNDIIYVMPGHAETITSATGCNLAVAGVRVVGLGEGADRPTFTFTSSNAATMTLDAASVRIKNLVFVCGKDGQTAMLDINADDCVVENCEFRNDATYQAVTLIDLTSAANGADRTVIRGCQLVSLTAGATQGIELGEVNDAVVIADNYIWGDWSAAGIHNIVGKIMTNLRIERNIIANLNSGDHAIELVSACTGMLTDNRMYGDTLGTILDPGSMFCNGNLETDAIDQAGVDSPRTSAGGFPADSITAAVIANDAIDASAIATDAIDADALAASAVDEIWDELTTGHVAAHAVGASLRALDSGTAQAGAAGTIQLRAAASAVNDFYNGAIVQIVDGTGVGQSRIITDYVGATTTASVTPVWGTNPGVDSVYLVRPYVGDGLADVVADEAVAGHVAAATVGAMLQPLHSGSALAGANGNIQLAATASATNDLYNGNVIQIISGTGAGQTRLIYDYDGATTTASVVPNWTTNPAAASIYVIQPAGSVQVDRVTAGVIAAASFAAGAIDAAAIAASAIDADSIAGDAITNAKIADNALATEQFALSAGEKTTDGIVVTRATGALPQTAGLALFTVTGHVLLKRIIGVVTANVGGVANVTHLRLNSTGAGATTDICLAAGGNDITGDAADTTYEITGTVGEALVATTNLPKAPSQLLDLMLVPGSLELACAGSDGGGGRVRWSATYVPMEAGAQMVAA